MTLLRSVITIPHVSGLPEDSISNRIYVGTGSPALPSEGDLGAIAGVHGAFYASPIGGGGNAVQDYLSRMLDGGNAEIRIYQLSDPEPRAPVFQTAFPLAIPIADALPSEMAACNSYQAVQVAGVNQARRRGRFYIGPLAASVSAGNPPRPSSGFRNVVALASQRMRSQFTDIPGLGAQWVVLSGLDAPEAPPTAPVVNGWIDDAFDVQRRRGEAPTVRETWVA